ncbi:MAG: putative phosphohydrolase, partial [Pseudohongiellaceae bacterium]
KKAKLEPLLPEGVLALDAEVVQLGGLAITGTRLWDTPQVTYHEHIVWQGEPISAEQPPDQAAAAEKVFRREIGKLERCLASLPKAATQRLAMVHYPPVSPGLAANEMTAMFEKAGVSQVVFGHLHSLDRAREAEIGGQARGVTYHCTACDFIDFAPKLICEIETLPEGG